MGGNPPLGMGSVECSLGSSTVMRNAHWLIFGVPALGLLGANDAWANDPIVSFAVPSDTAIATSSERSLTDTVPPKADDYRLNFQPPLVTTTAQLPIPSPATADAIAPPSSRSPSPTVNEVPVTPPEEIIAPPPDPVPVGNPTTAQLPPPPLPPDVTSWFVGGEQSLVAIAVGHAEGTRTATGERTSAYYGHVDPGNQAWNQGSFSYQHGARSPEEADQKQLARLKHQTKTLHQLAFEKSLTLDQPEFLNAIDLANQAPAAAIDRGYIDWLQQAKTMGLRGDEAILWARTRSFLDPDTQRWNAPGLGNSVDSITRDQERRQQAIARVLATYNQSSAEFPATPPQATFPPPNAPPVIHSPPEAIDLILQMDALQ